MKDISTLTAEAILAIPADQPELLFTGDVTTAKQEYRRLASIWHPDQNPNVDEKVIAHVNALYGLAEARLAFDDWVPVGAIIFKSIDGRKFQLKYRSRRSFELGDIYVGDTTLAYSLFKDDEDLFKNAVKSIKGLKYANDKMKGEFKKLLPEIVAEVETGDRWVIIIKKTPDQLLLSDVLDYFKGKVDPKHVAWMVSRLYNLVCYLKYANLVHAGITPDACLVSPEFHTISLVGGWWYSTPNGKQLKALPSAAVEFAPSDVIMDEIADQRIDLELLRAVGRELLGDINGSSLLMDKSVPTSLTTWLRSVSVGDAFKEYDIWQKKILIDSFGPRKFVELKLSADDLYGEKS